MAHPTLADTPHVLADFDAAANPGVDPAKLTMGSSRRVAWRCATCDHTWNGQIATRRWPGRGNCPACSGRTVHRDGRNSLQALHPEVAAEWDLTANDKTPTQVRPGCNDRVWWSCSTCEHRWQAKVLKRTQGRGCPACAGQVVRADGSNSLAAERPEIAAQWHPDNELSPEQVRPRSGKAVKWRCSDCTLEWTAKIIDRTAKGYGCRDCSAKNKSYAIPLSEASPALAAQWHPTRNGKLTPDDVVCRSKKRVWWQCNDCAHEFHLSPATRMLGGGDAYCAACTGRQVHSDGRNSLAATHPHIAAQIHQDDPTDPTEHVAGAHRTVRFLCPDCNHDWTTGIRYRTGDDNGCPACHGRVVNTDGTTSLAALHPDVAAEWHPTRNGELTASDIRPNSTLTKIWWQCRTCQHEWQTTAASRVGKEAGCAACAGRIVKTDRSNALTATHPDIAAQWHTSNDLPVDVITTNSQYHAEWICDEGHITSSSVQNRTSRASVCPVCTPVHRSQEELALARELAQHLDIDPDEAARLDGWNGAVDIVDHGRRLVIEWDGSYWHQGKEERDRRKSEALTEHGWTVIRLREAPLKPIGPHDVVVPQRSSTQQRAQALLEQLETMQPQVA